MPKKKNKGGSAAATAGTSTSEGGKYAASSPPTTTEERDTSPTTSEEAQTANSDGPPSPETVVATPSSPSATVAAAADSEGIPSPVAPTNSHASATAEQAMSAALWGLTVGVPGLLSAAGKAAQAVGDGLRNLGEDPKYVEFLTRYVASTKYHDDPTYSNHFNKDEGINSVIEKLQKDMELKPENECDVGEKYLRYSSGIGRVISRTKAADGNKDQTLEVISDIVVQGAIRALESPSVYADAGAAARR